MATVTNQYGTFETDKQIGGKRLPSNPQLESIAQKLYGKSFDDLTIEQRTKKNTPEKKKKVDKQNTPEQQRNVVIKKEKNLGKFGSYFDFWYILFTAHAQEKSALNSQFRKNQQKKSAISLCVRYWCDRQAERKNWVMTAAGDFLAPYGSEHRVCTAGDPTHQLRDAAQSVLATLALRAIGAHAETQNSGQHCSNLDQESVDSR